VAGANEGRESPAAGGRTERCGDGGRWPVAEQVQIWCVAKVRYACG
jgi:hypothetical protein